MDLIFKFMLIFGFLSLLTYHEIDGQSDKFVPTAAAKAENDSSPILSMAVSSITVGEYGLDLVPITAVLSYVSSYQTGIDFTLEHDSRRYVYLTDTYAYIPAGELNVTTYLKFEDYEKYYYQRDTLFNVSISSCSSCSYGSPSMLTTTVVVKPENNVTLWFYNENVGMEECYCPEGGCSWCFTNIEIGSDIYFDESINIPLQIAQNSTATYKQDFYFDTDPPSINVTSEYSTYHYLKVYPIHDEAVEGTEYFTLQFDEANLPERIIVGSPKSSTISIYDDDYGFFRIKIDSSSVLETVGTVKIVVETNIVQEDTDMEFNISMLSYAGDDTYATPYKDYIPFAGSYVIAAGTNSTVIMVTILDDDLAENEEELSFNLQAYYKARDMYFYEYGRLTIEDDETQDTPLKFFFEKDSIFVNESSGTLDIYVKSNLKSEGVVYLDFLPPKQDGMMEYRDYTTYFNNTIRVNIFRFEAATEYLIQIDIINDCEIENLEILTLNLSMVSIGMIDDTMYSLTILVQDNDEDNMLNCAKCSGNPIEIQPTEPTEPTEPNRATPPPHQATPPPPDDKEEVPVEVLIFNFEIDELAIFEGQCSFHDINVVASVPTNATVFIGIQPWELVYNEDFTVSAKKLVFDNTDRHNFSFRALQDTEVEDVESTLLNIAYASDGTIGQWNVILVHVFDEPASVNSTDSTSIRKRSVDDVDIMTQTRTENTGSSAITTGLIAGLVSSLLVVMVTSTLVALIVIVKKSRK